MRFSNHMLCEVDRKIAKGKQRLQLMNKGDPQPVYVSKFQDQVNNLNARIKKLIGEAEEAGNRGDVDQAQGLMSLCDQLKDEKDALVRQHESSEESTAADEATTAKSTTATSRPTSPSDGKPTEKHEANASSSSNRGSSGGRSGTDGNWQEFHSTEKQMEVCEVCGAFLIVGDAQQRLEDHLTGKQHMGYSRLRKAVDEMYEKRKQERDEEERLRDEERRHKFGGSGGGGSDGGKFSRKR